MEKTVLQQKETYMDSVHRWGRIWGLSPDAADFGIPDYGFLDLPRAGQLACVCEGFICHGPDVLGCGCCEIFTMCRCSARAAAICRL